MSMNRKCGTYTEEFLLSYKENLSYDIFSKLDGTGEYYIKLGNPGSKSQTPYVLSHI